MFVICTDFNISQNYQTRNRTIGKTIKARISSFPYCYYHIELAVVLAKWSKAE